MRTWETGAYIKEIFMKGCRKMKTNKFKLNLKTQQVMILLDEIEKIKTYLVMEYKKFDYLTDSLSNVSEYIRVTDQEEFNLIGKIYESKYEKFEDADGDAFDFGWKVCRNDKFSSEELSQLLLLLNNHIVPILYLHDKNCYFSMSDDKHIPKPILKELEIKEEKRISKNSDLDEILNHLAHLSDEMNSVIGGGKYYEKN